MITNRITWEDGMFWWRAVGDRWPGSGVRDGHAVMPVHQLWIRAKLMIDDIVRVVFPKVS